MEAPIVHRLHTARERIEMFRQHLSIICEHALGHILLEVHAPVNSRRWVGSSVIADPEAPSVQLHCDVIVVAFIQQDTTVLISSNLKTNIHQVLFTKARVLNISLHVTYH